LSNGFARCLSPHQQLSAPTRDVNYCVRVRYYDYKRFTSTVGVKELG